MYAMSTEKSSLVWKGSTVDNDTLQLTNAGLERIISQLPEQPDFKNFVKRNYKGDH